MPAFHGHDDDFLYEIQQPRPPSFALPKNSDLDIAAVTPVGFLSQTLLVSAEAKTDFRNMKRLES